MADPLQWGGVSGLVAVDPDGGTWALNAESTRGERRLYWVDDMPHWARRISNTHNIDLAHWNRTTLFRRIERIRAIREKETADG